MDMWCIKEMIQCVSLGIPKGKKTMQFLFLLHFALTSLSEMKI